MKLYTEEQVRKAIHIKSNNIDLLTSDDILGLLTPIELPSDADIEKIFAKKLILPTHNQGFQLGVEWVIE